MIWEENQMIWELKQMIWEENQMICSPRAGVVLFELHNCTLVI